MEMRITRISMIVALFVPSGLAMATPGFMFPTDLIQLMPGVPAEIPILAAPPEGSVAGMSLYLETMEPFEIVDLQPGEIWPEPPIIIPPPPDPSIPPQLGILYVSPAEGPILIYPGAELAAVTFLGPVGTPVGTMARSPPILRVWGFRRISSSRPAPRPQLSSRSSLSQPAFCRCWWPWRFSASVVVPASALLSGGLADLTGKNKRSPDSPA